MDNQNVRPDPDSQGRYKSAIAMSDEVKPQWIAKMYKGKPGLDHLGLGSVTSDQILPTLSPSINVLNFHPRYYSFYTFLVYEYWQTERLRSRQSWVDFYRPREFIFSVGANMCDQPEHGEMGNIVGSQKTYSLARNDDDFDTTFHYIDTDLGGYGLYYRSVIAQMGLIFPGGRGFQYPVDSPTKLGEEIALAFREGVKDTEYYRDYFGDDQTKVPRSVVLEYIRSACLCRLRTLDAQEHDLLLDIYLSGGLDPHARRGTFRMFLDIASQSAGKPLEETIFRQLIYFGSSVSGSSFQPRIDNISTRLRWRLYQAREYYALALNALWNYFCIWGLSGGGDLQPLSYADFWLHFEGMQPFDSLAKDLDLDSPGISLDSAFRRLIDWVRDGSKADDSKYLEDFAIDVEITEHRLFELITDDLAKSGAAIAGSLAMLALIFSRFSSSELEYRDEWQISQMGHDGRLSLDGFVRDLRERLASGPIEIREVLHWLYDSYIIRQHLMVASRKMPENTYRFRRERDGMRFYTHTNPVGFTNSRFDAIATTLLDLGLSGDLHEADHPLTAEGKTLLAEGTI